MVDETPNYENNRERIALEKKLRKREQRLLGRLQEAHVAHENALERFQRAEARLFKRAARVQRLDVRLATLRHQIAALASSKSSTTDEDTKLVPDNELTDIQQRALAEDELLVAPSSLPYENETDPLERARLARAVATATEEAARLAVERAHEVALRLAHRATGRHLIQELLPLEADAARASVIALDAELAAQEAERQATASPAEVVPLSANESIDEGVTPNNHEGEQEHLPPSEEVATSMAEDEEISKDEEGEAMGVEGVEIPEDQEEPAVEEGKFLGDTATDIHAGLPSLEEQKRVAEIDEEESMVEMVTSMMIADVAAARAAKAEALAEEASTHTREAQRLAQEADAVLERIRTAIQNGTSTGDAAQAILFDAERDATRTHALLADAEAAEERARRIAMEAEADAEVAEGMAFATEERTEDADMQREQPASRPALDAHEQAGDRGTMERLNISHDPRNKSVEDEDTIETPSV